MKLEEPINQDGILKNLEKLSSEFQLYENFSYFDFKMRELCENNYIHAEYVNGKWSLLGNQKLPCVDVLAIDEFKSAINQDELNILNNSYELVDSVELAYWPSTLYCYDEYVGFEYISIGKDIHKDHDGHLHSKYVLYIETFANVVKWTEPFEKILRAVDEIIIHPTDVYPCAVFDTETEAFRYAKLMYREYPLINDIYHVYAESNGYSVDELVLRISNLNKYHNQL